MKKREDGGMKLGSFEFNLRELSGSMGDFGTLLPLAVGYVTVCGMDPSGLLVFMGLANIATGLVYRLPMPIEPMKALAIMAIAQAWTPDKVLASGFAMGLTWLLFGLTGAMTWIAANTPRAVTRGIQLALGVQLALQGAKMASDSWILAIGALLVVLLLRKNRHAPAALVLVLSGVGIMAFQGKLASLEGLSLTLPSLHHLDFSLLWPAMRDGGLSQIPLTATNAVIATVALIREYWPDRPVTERQLALNMGIMNLVGPFIGGMPLCHGAGGLAGQYTFGARTGGTNLIEGAIEITLGLFLARSIGEIFAAFPLAIVGSMMFVVGVELLKFIRLVRTKGEWPAIGVTLVVSVAGNMALGFAAGILYGLLSSKIAGKKVP
jgi:MFS superfamily sulfate permease-like transporter